MAAPLLAITGATGFVGQNLLDVADRREFQLRCLTRRDQNDRPCAEWISGDLSSTDSLDRMMQGSDAVIHIAGVVNAVDEEGFLHGNVTGTENVVRTARNAGVRRFVHVSSLAAREPGLSLYGRSKRLAEEVVQTSGLDWTIVRPPAVYGPRDTEMLELFKAAKWRIVPMPPAGRTSVIHVNDLARLLLDLTVENGSSNRIFEPDDGIEGGWSHTSLAKVIGAAVGKRIWAPNVPARLLMQAARLDRQVRGNRAKLTPDRASYMAHRDWVSDPGHAVPKALWGPRIDTVTGLRQTARWYRDVGWL